MPRFVVLLLIASLALALVAACGDDDDDPGVASEPTATSPRETSVTKTPASDGGDATATPDEGSDEKTPAPEETDGPTPAATAPGEQPTAPPAATTGTPAVIPENESLFLASLGVDIAFGTCSYNPSTAVADCGQYGVFAPNPPISGQGPECSAVLAAGVAEGLQCRTAEPLQTITYEIQN